MKFSLPSRYSRFLLFAVRTCQFYLLVIFGLCLSSVLTVLFGEGSLVVAMWSMMWLWLLRAGSIASILLVLSIIVESLR